MFSLWNGQTECTSDQSLILVSTLTQMHTGFPHLIPLHLQKHACVFRRLDASCRIHQGDRFLGLILQFIC